jgi:quinol monooxygenase YgiN
MIVVSAVLKANPGKEAELENLLKSLFPKVKEEQGVVEYVLHRAQGDVGKFFFYEKYEDKQVFDYHMSTSYLQQVFAQFDNLLNGKPEVEIYEDIATLAEY